MKIGSNKQITLGLLAHVDAGKTTLSEDLLYLAGAIRKRGRVDHGDAALDFYQQETDRGITIFSKQAYITYHENGYTLLDTPGHVDFSSEMERTLAILDYALVVVSALDGVQSHTQTIWRLLKRYKVPTFLFINKMDLTHMTQEELLLQVQKELDPHCICFHLDPARRDEEIALCDEEALEQYVSCGHVSEDRIMQMIQERKVFPVLFGSALKMQGIDLLMDTIDQYTKMPAYPDDFGARVFKVNQDEQGNRLTFVKITGGMLKVKEKIGKDEKADQIRRYCGKHFELLNVASAGMVCAIKGVQTLYPGEGLGFENKKIEPALAPFMTYQLHPVAGGDITQLYTACKQLAQEDPQLHLQFDSSTQQLHVQLMGEIQGEILQQELVRRFALEVDLDEGGVLYKETLAEAIEGVGHFEPLRHYAEVHLMLEPLPAGSGIQIANQCAQEDLAPSWQRLILSHIQEEEPVGVLGGFPVTDIRITLLNGKAHLKHTEGGDFREAVYRAIRHGLRRGKSILLEPYGNFRIEVPQENIGRVIYDIEKINGTFQLKDAQEGMSQVIGNAPLCGIQQCAKELPSYTKGKGRIYYTFENYHPCQHAETVLEEKAYDCDRDLQHPCGSIFCTHGAGFYVPWDEVEKYMHLPYQLNEKKEEQTVVSLPRVLKEKQDSDKEDAQLQAIFEKTYGSKSKKKMIQDRETYERHEQQRKKETVSFLPECVLVDGYNIIHDWEELRETAQQDLDAARHALINLMCNYQGYRKCTLILVFDAYKVKDQNGSVQKIDNIYVVYTKTAQTADSYIEQATHHLAKEYRVTVATSDGLEQLIAGGHGAIRISARGFHEEVMREHGKGTQRALDYQGNGLSQPLADLRKWQDKEK